MANPAGFVRDSGADVDCGARSWENRQIRIHGAAFGARSAIQSGSDHDRSTSKSNTDDRDMSFAGFILSQLLGLIGIRILSCDRDQTSPSEGKPHIIEKEEGARPQQPYCRDAGRQIDIDRMAAIEIDDIESFSLPGHPDQTEQVCS